jgi:thiamine biosynthesis lipoprotein
MRLAIHVARGFQPRVGGSERAALLVALLATSARSAPLERFEFTQPHMGTEVRIVLYAPTAAAASDASHAAFARFGQLDDELSDYRESSELTRLSRQAGSGPVKVSDDLFRVLRASQQLSRRSAGAFDVTVGPLSVIWRRARRLSEMPDPARLAEARSLVGSDKLELDEERRTARLIAPGMRLDLGGIAKGFAADEAAGVLSEHGIAAALVAAGGDIIVTDSPPGAAGWRVAIASGFDVSPPRHLTLHHAAVSTSGDAEQFVALDGVRYSHIIDPRTGMAKTGRSSVTIVAPDGTTSDGLATAVAVLGWAKGLPLVDATPGVAGLVMEATADGVRVHESAAWAKIGSPFRRTDPSISHEPLKEHLWP